MSEMMSGSALMWGTGIAWLFVLILIVLGIAAMVKYLVLHRRE